MNNYEKAVQQKITRQSEPKFHSFKQSYFTQQNYEIHKFLFWNYKKPVDKVVIPTGLCDLCHKLEIEHNND